MELNFKLKDVMHRITAKFYPAWLPEAKKAYNLRAKYQPELDIHGIASKAAVYNITTSPKVIEEGMTAGMELIYYLAADGYKIKTPVFNLKVTIPGEYDGNETHLPEGVHPQGRLTLSSGLRSYLKEHVTLQFDGIDSNVGIITEVVNLVTGDIDQTVSPSLLFEIRGMGLKIGADADHANDVGIYFEHVTDGSRMKVTPTNIALNEPRVIRAIVDDDLTFGQMYYVVVRTQLTAAHGGSILKNVREVKSDFAVKSL